MTNKITEDIMPALQGVIPAVLASASTTGIPNATFITQVYYVDENHVALARQFFYKTLQNIIENPVVSVLLTCPVTYTMYKLLLQFKESKKEGPIFDLMSLQLQAVAGSHEQSGTFSLQAADIFEILSIERIYPF